MEGSRSPDSRLPHPARAASSARCRPMPSSDSTSPSRRQKLSVQQSNSHRNRVTHRICNRRIEVRVADNLLERFIARVPFDDNLDAYCLKAHVWRLLLGSAGTPCRGVADIALEEQLEPRQLHLFPRRDGSDANGKASTQTAQHDFAGRWRGVFTEQVERFVDDNRLMVAHITERAIFPLHD